MANRASLIAAIILALVAGAFAADKRRVTVEEIMNMRAVGSAEISPDGSAVLFTVRRWEPAKESADRKAPEQASQEPPENEKPSGKKPGRMEARTHIFLVPSSGGAARQLTFGERGEMNPRWSPDGKHVSFTAARGSGVGEEAPKPQIWIMPADGGEPWQLTSAKEGVTEYEWSPDSKAIAFTTRDPLSKEEEERRKRRDDPRVFEGDVRHTHLWTIDVGTKKDRRLTEGNSYTLFGEPSWSPDGTRIAFSAAPTPMVRDDRRDLYVVNVSDGGVEKIAGTPEPEMSPKWSPDGKTIAYIAEPVGQPIGDRVTVGTVGNSRLMLYDVSARKAKDASSTTFDYSPGTLTWNRDGSRLVFTAGVRVWRDLFTYDVATGKYARATDGRVITSFSSSADGARWSFTSDAAAEPTEVWVAETAKGWGGAKKITEMNPQVKDLALGDTEVVTWKSADGMEIEGILLKPVGFEASKKYPLMVVVHGGPTGAHHNVFRVAYGDGGQMWASDGWAVLYPNVRGSTNYGEKFMRANIPDWGGGDYRDILSGVDALITRGIADPDKLAIQGWSYGGYMTAWVVSQTDRFKAAMMGAGLSDLFSMYHTTDVPGYLGWFFKGIPSSATTALYDERSAMTTADRVTTPLLILHGANDDRVPVAQSMEFYRALKDRGKTVELVLYPREGHGLQEYYHQVDRLERQYEWITKHTLGKDRGKTDMAVRD